MFQRGCSGGEDLDGEQAAELWAELIAWVSWFGRS